MNNRLFAHKSMMIAMFAISLLPLPVFAGRKIDLKITVEENKARLEGKLEAGDELRILLALRSKQLVLFASEMAREAKPITATLELMSLPANQAGVEPIPELHFQCEGRSLSHPVRKRDVIPAGNFRFVNSFAINDLLGVATIKDEKGQCEAVLWATITRRHPGDQAIVQPKLPKTPPGIWLELQIERQSDELQRLTVFVHNDSKSVFSFENGAEDGAGSLDDRERQPIGTAPTVLPEVTFLSDVARIVTRPVAFRTKGESPTGRTGCHVMDISPNGKILYASWKVPSDLVTDNIMSVCLPLLDGRQIKTTGHLATHGGPRMAESLRN